MSNEPENGPEVPEPIYEPLPERSYICQLKNGSHITIEGVVRVVKDGSGRRFYGQENEVIAAFDDGQSIAHWPANAPVDLPPEPGE